jgi:hypothetical protein
MLFVTVRINGRARGESHATAWLGKERKRGRKKISLNVSFHVAFGDIHSTQLNNLFSVFFPAYAFPVLPERASCGWVHLLSTDAELVT